MIGRDGALLRDVPTFQIRVRQKMFAEMQFAG
jgi:hypothetical protein